MSQRRIVTAISASLQLQHLSGGLDADDIAVEILERRAAMPDYLKLPMWIATLVFDLAGLVPGGRRFQARNDEDRLTQINNWKNSKLGACRNFVRFYESLFLLIVLQKEVL